MNKSESKYFNTATKFDKALLSLLETKSFEYITIKEICEKAAVNRSTFYLHYENTSDLLRETIQYVIDDFCASFPENTKSIAGQFQICNLQDLCFINEKYLFPYLSYIKNNRYIFQTISTQPALLGGDKIYQRTFHNIFNPILERFHYPPDDRHYVMMFYLNGITAIVTEWLRNGCDKSIQEIAEIISICIYGKDNTNR